MKYGSVTELIHAVVAPGERRLSFAAVHRILGRGQYGEVAVVLTDKRLLVASVAETTDYELTESFDLPRCSILTHEDQADGTSLLAVGHPDGVVALEFPVAWRSEAYTIRETMGKHPGTPILLDRSADETLRAALGDVWKGRLLTVPTSSSDGESARLLYEAVQGPVRPHAGMDEAFAQLHELAGEDQQDEDP